jgi:hypothetical protein
VDDNNNTIILKAALYNTDTSSKYNSSNLFQGKIAFAGI